MNQTFEQIIEDDILGKYQASESMQYYSKYMNKILPDVKVENKFYKLFFDDDRPALSVQELLLFNSLRYLHDDYNLHYLVNIGVLCKEKSYTNFTHILNNLSKKGYINVLYDKKYTRFNAHIVHNRKDSRVFINCLNQYGKTLKYCW